MGQGHSVHAGAVPVVVVKVAVRSATRPHALHLDLPALAHVFGDDVPLILWVSTSRHS